MPGPLLGEDSGQETPSNGYPITRASQTTKFLCTFVDIKANYYLRAVKRWLSVQYRGLLVSERRVMAQAILFPIYSLFPYTIYFATIHYKTVAL